MVSRPTSIKNRPSHFGRRWTQGTSSMAANMRKKQVQYCILLTITCGRSRMMLSANRNASFPSTRFAMLHSTAANRQKKITDR